MGMGMVREVRAGLDVGSGGKSRSQRDGSTLMAMSIACASRFCGKRLLLPIS